MFTGPRFKTVAAAEEADEEAIRKRNRARQQDNPKPIKALENPRVFSSAFLLGESRAK